MGISQSEIEENSFQRKERRSRELLTLAMDVFCLHQRLYFDFDSKGKSENGEKLNTEDPPNRMAGRHREKPGGHGEAAMGAKRSRREKVKSRKEKIEKGKAKTEKN